MILFIAALFIVTLIGCKPIFGKGFYKDYASSGQSRSINGIFIMLILFSHTFAKVEATAIADTLYAPIRVFLGQFVVVPFLFYSGYGIMESIKTKESYLVSFPKKRFFKLFLQFSLITAVYILMHLLLGSNYSLSRILLSFTGITSIGNGGWYMLSTFVFYIAIILSFRLFRNNKVLATLGVTFCLILLMITEMLCRLPSYYYSTTLFFAVGMFYSLLKDKFDQLVMKNNLIWAVCLLVSLGGFVVLKKFTNISVLFYPVWCGFCMLMILCITMKVKIQNKVLIWLGKTVFFIFTLQGIPQILFTKFLTNNYLIYTLVTATSLLLAFLADGFFRKLEKNAKKQAV